ncbi:MAG: arginine--tRNA ligase [Owenweeksia sp.]|nr:arginine--tRNA ligase [Owenweeksia sp.]MBF98942.1 arginine--tRNA ligase [Owenweeksia sp.]HBF19911.1 arginine--tRNA ligase [Cryomorphaceae bacterium]|tara:strand:+ start:22652 stop:24550 length:1899 start_codon:yes stop_codon:yes gene_type:complete
MDTLHHTISLAAQAALKELYQLEIPAPDLQQTRKEFEGDLTLVVFPYLKSSRKGPEQTGADIGNYLVEKVDEVSGFNVVKGFLNLVISDDFWLHKLKQIAAEENYGHQPEGDNAIMVEYSSPNTNKPLHLGHIRNNLLGYSVAELLKAAGNKVIKAQIINDRGIHICKSMVAWEKFGQGETPESSGMKGDHLVGKYYVEFDKAYRKEVEEISQELSHKSGIELKISPVVRLKELRKLKSEEISDQEKDELKKMKALVEEAEGLSPTMGEARQMLQKWEQNDPETIALWEKMNGWVYDGFEKTYERLGVDFDKYYYESQTYILGKQVVEEGLQKGVFFKKEDGSVWVDLSDEGLDQKLLLRSDGTSVYMTQDIGTAIQRFEDFKDENLNGMIYTVGNEQDYHFKVLFLILKKLGHEWADNLHHLSYGMVDLPSGKMKSREGTVVDADDLITQMETTAGAISEELGKTEGMTEEQKQELYHMVGMGALKYFILKVDPKKRMLFNPEESVDFQGNTGPFIQYTHARIKSLLRKGAEMNPREGEYRDIAESERNIVKYLVLYPQMVQQAATEQSPSVIANYVYDLVKFYNAFYQQQPILTDENETAIAFRLKLSECTARVVKSGMKLLGIEVPERM